MHAQFDVMAELSCRNYGSWQNLIVLMNRNFYMPLMPQQHELVTTTRALQNQTLSTYMPTLFAKLLVFFLHADYVVGFL
jgi:hypothetical protein